MTDTTRNCDECGSDNWKQLMHPSIDPEVDEPVWECQDCGNTVQGGW